MKNTEFWAYVNITTAHLLLPRERWTRIRNFLSWVASINWFGDDYTEAKNSFDSIVRGY